MSVDQRVSVLEIIDCGRPWRRRPCIGSFRGVLAGLVDPKFKSKLQRLLQNADLEDRAISERPLEGGRSKGLMMKRLFLVGALGVAFSPALAQQGPIPGLDKPTDCVLTRIKSIHARLENTTPRQSGIAVEYENGAYGVQYQLGDNPDKDVPGYSDYRQQKTYEDNIVASRVGDPIKLCLVSIPLHCPKGDGRGREYVALDLRNHRWWSLSDSEHMCGGA